VDILCFLDRKGRVLRDVFFEFIPVSRFEVEGRGSSNDVANGSKLEIDVYGIPDLKGCAIRMWELNEIEPVRHLERNVSPRSGGAACECRGH